MNPNPGGRRDGPGMLLLAGRICVAIVFSLLGLSFWSLQVGQYERLIVMAENNHDRTISLRAPRGAIVDRGGRVLVDNRYRFNISMIREQVTELDRSLELLGRVTGTSPDALRAAVDDQRNVPAFRPIVVVRDASLAQVAAVQARAIELPGVIVEHDPARHYPGRETASHLFGYVGEAQEHQLAETSDPRVAAGAGGRPVGHRAVVQPVADGARTARGAWPSTTSDARSRRLARWPRGRGGSCG